ncbi:hypothetical protein [Asticcacaulis benevestitus]|uniref:hypothetical protein n=1 Tax=Asticcacaulis benevestitus TaxID=347481 RepID=UPI0039B7263D
MVSRDSPPGIPADCFGNDILTIPGIYVVMSVGDLYDLLAAATDFGKGFDLGGKGATELVDLIEPNLGAFRRLTHSGALAHGLHEIVDGKHLCGKSGLYLVFRSDAL